MDENAIRMAILSNHLDEVDYYALLEIDRSADADAVRDGFHRFALRFHPDQHIGDESKRKQALTIFKRGAEAYRVLMKPELRTRYDETLTHGAVRLETDEMTLSASDDAALQVPVAARPFYEKAVELFGRGDLGGARMHLMLASARGESPAFDQLAKQIFQADRAQKK